MSKLITALVTPIIYPPLSSTQHTEIPVEFKALTFADPLNAEGERTIDQYSSETTTTPRSLWETQRNHKMRDG